MNIIYCGLCVSIIFSFIIFILSVKFKKKIYKFYFNANAFIFGMAETVLISLSCDPIGKVIINIYWIMTIVLYMCIRIARIKQEARYSNSESFLIILTFLLMSESSIISNINNHSISTTYSPSVLIPTYIAILIVLVLLTGYEILFDKLTK